MSNIIDKKLIDNYSKDIDFDFLLSQWKIKYQNKRPDIPIAGSPERTSFRIVIEDDKKSLYILENFLKNRYNHKLKIINTLDQLKKNNVIHIQPYLKSNTNEHIIEYKNSYWQLIPFIPGIPLNRPHYVMDSWRGIKIAEFLIDLRNKSESLSLSNTQKDFSLKSYAMNMIQLMKIHNPREYIQLEPIIHFIQNDFFKIYESLPHCFCHGDYHSLNIIWSENNIKSVIDWEFLGVKPEIYDIANMLGCIGIEEPTGLFQGLTLTFIEEIKKSNFITDISFKYLFDCILTLRFGWLAEWFRKNDTDMINLEITYMHLLLKNKEIIKRKWDLI